MTLIGELQSVDGYMNIALEQTKEYVDGQLLQTYGDAFIRGNNGTRFPLIHLNVIILIPFF
jgi:small nuclear ribonucleoprotein (snRNP)-like protein